MSGRIIPKYENDNWTYIEENSSNTSSSANLTNALSSISDISRALLDISERHPFSVLN